MNMAQRHPHNKNILFRKIAASLILANIFCASIALAQGTSGTTSGTSGTPAKPQTCEWISNPDPKVKTEYIVTTIVEEQFAVPSPTEGQEQGTIIVNCFRETKSVAGKDGKTQTVSSYVTKCTSSDCQRVQVFFSKTGSALLYSYISLIYKWAAGTIGIVSVFFLVYGGVRISTAGDNTGVIDEAKKKIMQSLTGLILLFLSAAILYTINPNFFTL
jgi:hypothetical protein